MNARRILIIIGLAILTAGCDALSPNQGVEAGKGISLPTFARMAAAPMAGAAAEAMPEAAPPPAPMQDEPGPTALAERKIMRSASVTIEVKRVAEAADRAKSIAVKVGGFLANSNAYEDNAGRKAIELTMRVPSDRLDATLAALKELGRVKEEAIAGEDVTEQYFDLEARLANARRLEARLLTLLESKAAKLKDMLDTERELGRVRESIEVMEGRKRFWDNRVSLSTIQCTFVQPQGFGRGIFAPLSGIIQKVLATFTTSLALLVVVFSAVVPWLVLLFAMAWAGLKLLRYWIRHKREAKQRKAQKHE